MKTVLVTGGAGFIGCHVVSELLKKKCKVTIIDNLSTGKKENLKGYFKDIKFIKGDISNLSLLKKSFKGHDYIIHLAALVSVPESVSNPCEYHEVNVTGTFNVFEAARIAKVKKVIFASSSAVYGQIGNQPVKESNPLNPISPYGASKLLGEQYAQMFYEVYGLATVCLRFFNVYGPKQSLKSHYASVIPKFAFSMQMGLRPPIHGTGHQIRDFVYVADVARAIILSAKSNKANGLALNVASGKTHQVIDIVSNINKLLKTDIKATFTPPRPGDVLITRADINKTKRIIKYKPLVSFEEGLSKTLQYYKG
jgi:nucleoside-diphosphate-sugar epimerase